MNSANIEAFPEKNNTAFQSIGKKGLLILLFFYFLTSTGELLHVALSIFKPKVGHLVAVVFCVFFASIFRKMVIPRSIFHAFLWLLLSQCISIFFSAHIERSIGYIGVYLFNFLFYFLIPINLFRVFDSSKILKIYFLAFCCLGFHAIFQIILSLFGLYDPFVTQTIGLLARGQGWTYEPSYYALYITAYVMFKNASVLLEKEEGFSWKTLTKLLGINAFLVASTSSGLAFSYPAFCLVTFWVTILRPLRLSATVVRWRIVKFMTLCCAISGVLSWIFWDIVKDSYFKFFYLGFENHGSFRARWEGIVSCWKIFLEYPLFGIGVGGVGPYLYKKNSLYDTALITLTDVETYDPTNVLPEVLASLGLIGFVGFIILACAFYQAFKKVITNSTISTSERNISTALFISLIMLLIVLQINQGLFRPYIWIHAGIVYGYLNSRGLATVHDPIYNDRTTARNEGIVEITSIAVLQGSNDGSRAHFI